MYVLNSPEQSLADLRSYQDWYLRYGLTSVDGVAEVASIGGFVRQYQVEVDPVRLRAYGISVGEVKTAIQRSNIDVGGRVVELAEREFMVRGLGYVKDVRDLENIVLDGWRRCGYRCWSKMWHGSPSDPRSAAVWPSGTGRERRWAASSSFVGEPIPAP